MTTDYTHPDYNRFKPLWSKVRDAAAGEEAVKAAGERYLPRPNAFDTSTEARERYTAYVQRAVYYNATGRTLSGLVGVAYNSWPQIETKKAELLTDANGSGVGLINQSQWALSEVLQTGRLGLLADYTRLEETDRIRVRSIADEKQLGLRPLVNAYSAEQILTWETQGGTLTRVVLSESHADYAGGEVNYLPQLRELLLEDGRYVVKLWRRHSEQSQFILVDTIDIGLSFIPFAFVGAVNNDAHPDQPPLLDLANLNLAHYRNSADYEESAFLLGQPMFAITGVNEEWIEKNGQVALGARRALPLPENGDAKILQVAPNTLAKEAMDNKERQMQTLGAYFLAPTSAVKTATQSAAETKSAYSTLSLACDNVSEGYTKVLQWLETWGGASRPEASFAIDTRFNDLTLDANAIRETVAAWQAGLVPQSDAWSVLRRLGVIDQGKTDEQLASEIEGQGAPLDLDRVA